MNIMEFRNTELERTLNGINDTGIPLIAKIEANAPELQNIYGSVYRDAGFTDDTGIYYFIPKIAKIFGLSIDTGIHVFIISLVLIGFIIGISCFFCFFKNWYSRLFAFVGQVLLAHFVYEYQDVYIAGHFAVATIIPSFLLLTHRSTKFNFLLISCLGLSGIVVGYCNLIRIYSGIGALLFVLIWLILNKYLLKKEKFFGVTILLLFTSLPYMHFAALKAESNKFLITHLPSYQEISHKHPTWHNIYIGLSYLNNKYVPGNAGDLSALDAAKTVNPKVVYCSDEYSQILRDIILLIAKKDPEFILKTICAKFVILFLILCKYANFGLLCCFFIRFTRRDLIPFFCTFCVYALPGILTRPETRYVLGMISISIIFGIYMIGLGLEKFCKIKFNFKNFITIKHFAV